MNIKEAKEQIKNAVTAYFTKDEFGSYVIPIEKQRPIFLIGAPGIGKTAIMEQIASELNVGLVSYSMTHHTRQSALGLPFITKKNYGGVEYSVSEYTMSEIIASVYDMIEETGHKEGILFLDEINCVSETLAPAMLQFLQYKVFGRHRVPDGWIVVTAGNPPEYNNSVREFDIVTWDRIKRVDVEADYDVWKEYAINSGVHAAVTTYLEIKKANFYSIESTVGGKSFVTARGWVDLSEMIKLYEKHDIKVDKRLVVQYVQNNKIATEFASYYDLFIKYKKDYAINDILTGKASDSSVERMKNAKFDERISVIGLILDAIYEGTDAVSAHEDMLRDLLTVCKQARSVYLLPDADYCGYIEKSIEETQTNIKKGKQSSSLSASKELSLKNLTVTLEKIKASLLDSAPKDGNSAFAIVKTEYDSYVKELAEKSKKLGKTLDNAFAFFEKAFGESQEMLVLVTELTLNRGCARFISRYGCDAYFRHNKELLLYEREKELINEIEDLELN